MELYQLFVTDAWGSHASRTNLGVFSEVQGALYSIVKNENGECPDFSLLKEVFTEDTRLFVEQIFVDKAEGYGQIFDSKDDANLRQLKKIVFFETVERFRNDLGFLSVDEEDIPFDMSVIESPDDVTDDMVDEYMEREKVVQFLKDNFEE